VPRGYFANRHLNQISILFCSTNPFLVFISITLYFQTANTDAEFLSQWNYLAFPHLMTEGFQVIKF
jgi:hypothetical protein